MVKGPELVPLEKAKGPQIYPQISARPSEGTSDFYAVFMSSKGIGVEATRR